jgi:aldehyde dehydrogenase (NAD+)
VTEPGSSTAFLDGPAKRLLIGGAWQPAALGKVVSSIDPATGRPIAEVADGTAEDVERAVLAARTAFEGPWRRCTPAERMKLILRFADIVEQHADELSVIDTLDMGAPLARARAGITSGLARLRWNAAQAVSIHGETPHHSLPGEFLTYTVKEPVGVVAAIIPWNSPVASALWKLGPVLASGCTVVLKPAEEAPLTALRLGELALEAGVPEGVINIVTGAGEIVGAALTAHPDVDKVAFTGSFETAQAVIRASAGNMKRLSLELGGKSPNIVFADADVETAALGAANAIFLNSGQICSAGSRLFVERPVYDELVAQVADLSQAMITGSGLDPATHIGPLVSRAQLDRVTGYLEAGRRQGAGVVSGGHRLTDAEHIGGYFVPPTVFRDVTDDMVIAREEIFGPVLSALPFETLEEVAARANAIPGGLASGIWTRDGARAHRLARMLRAGTVWINCYQVMDPAMPFGGYGTSGYGREGGIQHLEEYLQVKSVYAKLD